MSIRLPNLPERFAFLGRVEIIKAGIGRFWPHPERLLLEHYGLKYEPDLILVGFLPNDIVDTILGVEAVQSTRYGYLVTREAKQLGDIPIWLYIHSHFFRVLFSRIMSHVHQRRYEFRSNEIFKDGHCNSEGYHVIADTVYAEIMGRKLIRTA